MMLRGGLNMLEIGFSPSNMEPARSSLSVFVLICCFLYFGCSKPRTFKRLSSSFHWKPIIVSPDCSNINRNFSNLFSPPPPLNFALLLLIWSSFSSNYDPRVFALDWTFFSKGLNTPLLPLSAQWDINQSIIMKQSWFLFPLGPPRPRVACTLCPLIPFFWTPSKSKPTWPVPGSN